MEEDTTRSYYTLTLKKSEEARLEQVFKHHCDAEGQMKLYQFLLLCLEKGIVSNACPLYKALNVFKQASGEKDYIKKSRFFFAITLLARAIFPDEISPVEQMFTKILVDPMVEADHPNLPLNDETNVILLSEGPISEFESCEQGLLQVLMSYNTKNIENRRKVIGVKQITDQNLGISARNFLRYCRISNIIPHLINIETFQSCIKAIVPPNDIVDQAFYDSKVLIKEYENEADYSQVTPLANIKGEPELKLHHLQLVMGRIAVEGLVDIDNPVLQIRNLFLDKLQLHQTESSAPGLKISYPTEYDSDASFSSQEDFEELLSNYRIKKIVSSKGYSDEKDLLEVVKEVPYIPEIHEVLKMLDNERAPQLPLPPKILTENPNHPPVLFPLPPPPEPKNQRQAPQRQQNNKQKEEKASDQLKFASLPGSFNPKLPEKSRYDKFSNLRNQLSGNLHPLNAKQTFLNPGIHPCLIQEILQPPPSPPNVATLVESCFIYQNSKNLSMAVQTLDKAKTEWQKEEGSDDLPPEVELFLEITRASIFQSSSRDELALGQCFSVKPVSDKLPPNNPNKALIYCTMGSALCHLGHYQAACRCYLKAKEIRERILGGDTVDTASVYNNLGVCMYYLERYREAYAYIELAEAILDMILGPNHPRTLSSKQNLSRVKRTEFIPTPEFYPVWSKQYVDPFPKKGKKGKKGKKKKKGKK